MVLDLEQAKEELFSLFTRGLICGGLSPPPLVIKMNLWTSFRQSVPC